MKKFFFGTTLLLTGLLSCTQTPPSTITDVTLSATKVVLKETENTVLSATVTGTGAFNNALTWAIEGGAVGSLSSNTGASVTYTAPNSTFGRVVRVTATSVQDSSKKKTIFLGVHPNKPSIAAGGNHSLALKSDGTVLAWGSDEFGQLGDGGTNTDQSSPVAVSGATDVVAVSAGGTHSLALKSDGTVLAWGGNGNGQLGTNDGDNRNTAVTTMGATGVVSIAAGGVFSLALKSDGTLLAWGSDQAGQLGDDTTLQSKSIPVPVANATNIVAIAAGGIHALALKSDGTVLAWGADNFGQLGDDATLTNKPMPVAVAGASGIVALGTSVYHSLALKSDGTVLAWGYNVSSQLGDGTTTNRPTPIPVLNASGIVALAGGVAQSVMLKSDGTVLRLGRDYVNNNVGTPTAVINASNVVSIASGDFHTLMLKSDGTLLAWGTDKQGKLGDGGTNTDQGTSVSVALGMATIRLP